jgi:hypothetical protein
MIPRQGQAESAFVRHGGTMEKQPRTRTRWKSALLALIVLALAIALARGGQPMHGMWDGPL